MKISAIIAALEKAKQEHGDLPTFTTDSDISRVEVHPCRDGCHVTVNGVPEVPDELVIEFIPA